MQKLTRQVESLFSRSWQFSQGLSWWHLWSMQGNKEASGIHCLIVWEYGTQLLPLCSWSVSEVLGGEFSFLHFLQKKTIEYLYVLRICYYICFRQSGDQNKTINNKVKTYIKTKEYLFFKKHLTHSCMWNCTFVNLDHIGSCWNVNLVIKWNCSFLTDNRDLAYKDLRSRHLNIPVIIIKNLLYIRSGDKNKSLNVNSILTDSLNKTRI